MDLELQIPELDDYAPDYENLNPCFKTSIDQESISMLQSFSPSFFGQIVKVWYVLRVFVKHDAWNEWGEGHSVDFPIKILPKPTLSQFQGLTADQQADDENCLQAVNEEESINLDFD